MNIMPDQHPPHLNAPRRIVTETHLFPLAAGWAAFAVPFSVHGLLGGSAVPPGLATSTGHAHELLFGYALAVVAGFLINRVTPSRLWLLIGCWGAGRVAFIFAPDTIVALLANGAFAVLLGLTAAPRFMKAAKKWRNRIIGPLVLALCATLICFHAMAVAGAGGRLFAVAGIGVLLLALLMLFFGGRLIAPAAAGAIEAIGGRLEARVQPRLEGLLLGCMLAAIGSLIVFRFIPSPVPALAVLPGFLLITAGVLALIRLLRWQLWLCGRRIDLICLGLGYAWLGVGLVAYGLNLGLAIGPSMAVTTHAITIGALGTLTCNVMARVRLLRLRIPPQRRFGRLAVMTLAMSAAAVLRILADTQALWLYAAAACWALAQLILLSILLFDRTVLPPGKAGRGSRRQAAT